MLETDTVSQREQGGTAMELEGEAGWPDDVEAEAQAAAQEALNNERDEIDTAASEDVEEERTVPWSKNTAWDGDTSFLAGLYEIGVQISNTVPVIAGYDQLVEYGELDEEVQRRTLELSISERVLIYSALQVFGIVSGERWREKMDSLLTRLEELVEATEIEEVALAAAEQLAARVVQEKLKEHFAQAFPDVGVYTPEEFEEELSNPDTEDESIKRLQDEQHANLN